MSVPIPGAARYDAEALRKFIAAVLQTAGVSVSHASLTAQALVDANLRGVDTHGITRLPIYMKRLGLGAMNPTPNVRVVVDNPTSCVVDGDAGLGQVAMDLAVRATLERARAHGMCWTGIRNSSHNGTQGYWALHGAREGMVTLGFTNGESIMAAWGGSERFLSTNPICIAIPTDPPDELILDMATSQVAAGHILLALSRGESIPQGWALDSEGKDTTNPKGFMDGGTVLPLGGYKGAGLSLMIDILAGVLSGAASTTDIGGLYWTFDRPQNVGHALCMIDVSRLQPLGQFKRRVGATVAAMRATTKRPGVDRILAPGDLERERLVDRTANGCPLTPDLIRDLTALGTERGVEFPPPV